MAMIGVPSRSLPSAHQAMPPRNVPMDSRTESGIPTIRTGSRSADSGGMVPPGTSPAGAEGTVMSMPGWALGAVHSQ